MSQINVVTRPPVGELDLIHCHEINLPTLARLFRISFLVTWVLAWFRSNKSLILYIILANILSIQIQVHFAWNMWSLRYCFSPLVSCCMLALPLVERLQKDVEFIWSHIFSNIFYWIVAGLEGIASSLAEWTCVHSSEAPKSQALGQRY